MVGKSPAIAGLFLSGDLRDGLFGFATNVVARCDRAFEDAAQRGQRRVRVAAERAHGLDDVPKMS